MSGSSLSQQSSLKSEESVVRSVVRSITRPNGRNEIPKNSPKSEKYIFYPEVCESSPKMDKATFGFCGVLDASTKSHTNSGPPNY